MSRYVLDKSRGFIHLSGPDARRFLQGLITNDMEQLTPQKALYSALLTPQGRYLFDFFVIELPSQILIDVDYDRMADLFTLLRKYRLRSQVQLECFGPPQTVAYVFDSDAASKLELANETGSARVWDEGFVCVDPRLQSLGCRTTLSDQELQEKGCIETSSEEYNKMRLELGVPLSHTDFIIDKSIPLECNLDEMNAIGWDKGCYLGQELTTRTKHRGLVRKRLLPVSIKEGAVPFGTPLLINGDEVGSMRSSCENRGIAMIRLEALERIAAGEELRGLDAKLSPLMPEWLKITA